MPGSAAHFGWLWLVPAALLGVLLLAVQGLPPGRGGLQDVRIASEAAYRAGPSVATVRSKAELPDRFDRRFKGQSGTARYVVPLPNRAASGPTAVFFPRVGNQVEFRLNGRWLAQLGTAGDGRFDAAKSPTLLPLPDELLRAEGNALEVTIHAQPGRWSGLSNGLVGPADAVGRSFHLQLAMRTGAAMVFFVSMLLMGVLALGLWRQERQELYLCFAAAAVAGALPNLDRVLVEVPLDGALWGGLVAIARAWHIALMCGFLLLLSGADHWMPRRLILGYLPLSVLLVVLQKAFDAPILWDICLGLLVPIGFYALWHVARRALRGEDRYAWPLLAAGGVAAVVAVHDYGTVLLGWRDETHFAVLPHATFAIVIVMGWVIVERYARALREYHELARTLEQRVAEREATLRRSLAALRASEHEQAVLSERQRIMRDIHDGVGAQLVGLISLVGHGAERAPLREHAQAALDELRIAVDSLQTAGDDLATVLGTTRYRLQQRFDAAEIAFDWQVGAEVLGPALTPSATMHVQRILFEALTNVLKHARAKHVVVTLRRHPSNGRSEVVIDDDGVGCPASSQSSRGHGIRNMRSRAEALGGEFVVEKSVLGGTSIRLTLPAASAPNS